MLGVLERDEGDQVLVDQPVEGVPPEFVAQHADPVEDDQPPHLQHRRETSCQPFSWLAAGARSAAGRGGGRQGGRRWLTSALARRSHHRCPQFSGKMTKRMASKNAATVPSESSTTEMSASVQACTWPRRATVMAKARAAATAKLSAQAIPRFSELLLTAS